MYTNENGQDITAEQVKQSMEISGYSDLSSYLKMAGLTPGKKKGSVTNADPDPDPNAESWWNTGLGSEDGFSESANTNDPSKNLVSKNTFSQPKNTQKRDSLVFNIQETEKQINNYIKKGGEVNKSDAAVLKGYKNELLALDKLELNNKFIEEIRPEVSDIYKKNQKNLKITEIGTIDFDNEKSIADFRNNSINDFVDTNKTINNKIIPLAKKEINNDFLTYENQAKAKYNLLDPKNITQDNIDLYTKDVSSYYNKLLNSKVKANPEFKSLINGFNTVMDETAGASLKRFTKGKDWEAGLAIADLAESSPFLSENLVGALTSGYAMLRGIWNGFNKSGQIGGIQLTTEKVKSLNTNKELASKNNWTNETKGYWVKDDTNDKGSYIFKPKFASALGWQDEGADSREQRKPAGAIEGTWGQFQGEANAWIESRDEKNRKNLLEVQEEEFILNAYDNDSFKNITEGKDVVKNTFALIGEQLPQMGLALVTLGASGGLQIGSSIYAEGIDNRAREIFDLPEGSEVSIAQKREVMMDDRFMSNLAAKATGGGFLAGQLDKFGAGKVFKGFIKGGAQSILRGGMENFLKRAGSRLVNNTIDASVESITEVLQEVIESGAAGSDIKSEQLFEAGGTGFLVSMVTGLGGSVRSQTIAEVKTTNRLVAGKLNPKSAEAFFNGKIEEIDKDIESERVPSAKEELQGKRQAILDARNANLTIPSNFSTVSKEKIFDLVLEKQSIEKQIKNKDPELVKEQTERIQEINKNLNAVSAAESITQKALKAGKDVVGGFEQTDVAGANKILLEEGESPLGENVDGFFKKDGSFVLVMDRISEKGVFNTAAHEILHKVLYRTLIKEDSEGQIQGSGVVKGLRTALESELNKLDSSIIKDKKFQARLELYKNEPESVQAEEVLTLFADALAYGEISYSDSLGAKLKDIVRRVLQDLGIVDVEFNTGKDVYNFLKDYNKGIKKGKLGKAFTKASKEGIKVGKDISRSNDDFNFNESKKSKNSGKTVLDTINELVPAEVTTQDQYFNRKVFNPIYKATENNGVISNYVKSKSPSKEVAAKTIKSIQERLVNYDPAAERKKAGNKQPITFGEFIFANTNFGKLDAKKALFKESEDAKKTTDLDNKEAQSKISEDDVVKKDIPKFRKLIDSGVLPGVTIKDIGSKLTKVLKVLKSKLDAKVSINKSVSPLIAEIKQAMGKQADIDLKEAMGGKADAKLQKWLLKNKKAVLENMTTTWLMGAIPQAIQKSVGGTYKVDDAGVRIKDSYGDFTFVPNFTSDWQGKTVDREKTSTNKLGKTAGGDIVRRLPNIATALSDADFVSSVLEGVSIDEDGNMTSGAPIRGRKESMAKAIAEEISLEVFNRELQNENSEISKAFENNQAARGVVLGDNFVEDIVRQSERGTIKFSVSTMKNMFFSFIEGDAAAVDNLYDTLDPESKAIWESISTQLDGGSQGYKQGLKVWKDAPNAIKGILAEYFKDNSKRDNEKAMKQLDVFSNKLIDALPNSLVKALGFEFFGAHFRYLNTIEGTKGGDIKNKIKLLEADGINLNFNVEDIIIVQAGYGLVDKITKDVLNKKFDTVQDKIDYFNKNYKDKVDALNIANKQAAQAVLEAAFDIIAKDPAQAVGFLRLLESTTNIGKSLRGLTGISDIQFHAESQAVYLNTDTGSTYSNTLTKPQQKLFKEGVIVINEKHPNYKDAVKAIKDGSKQSLDQLLRIKGEHATSDAKKKLAIAKMVLDHVAMAMDNPTQLLIIKNAFAAKLAIELQNFSQQLNTKVLSDMQDSKLGSTSDIGDARLTVIPKESLLAFYDIEGIQIAGRVNRAFNDMFTLDKIKELAKVETEQKAINNARSIKWSLSPKKIRVFDFDDTLARTKSNVLYTMPNGTTGKIDAATFAREAGNMEAEGAQWDFSEFSKVMDGKAGPLFEVAKIIADKRGTKDVFVLTARPADAAGPIQEFLASLGLNIPIENITGLGNGSPKAKADWVINKVAEGYNDFYFADDHTGNVKAVKDVLDTFDVKGKVQLAKVKFSKSLDVKFNEMIQRQKGVESFKEFSKSVAQRRGKKVGKFKLFISPSAEDFRGLTQYKFAGKGKQGEADQRFFEESLMDPYFQGIAAIEQARQTIKNDTAALLSVFKPVKKKLNKLIEGGDYTNDAAVRVYLWNKAGYEIPGISKRDNQKLNDLVANDPELSAFANGLLLVSKKDAWPEPGAYWTAQTTLSDLNDLTEKGNRKEYLAEFIENVDIVFSEKNLNKVEAIYGEASRKAIENAIFAMKTGSNSPNQSADGITSKWMNWVNSSVGTIMFFNRRSAVLQLLSTTNFINWSDNNPAKAALAFANQPQYWKDFVMIFNSDKLKQRRGGLKSDVQESEIANAAKNTQDKAQAIISYILKLGFTPTQIADSFAISSGGATMYRNRVNTYKKQGMTEAAAETKAFEDFSKLSDEAQQSGDPALVSQQQRSVAGRLILSFQNTTMQYTRLMKKSGQDLINGRGDAKTHISMIIYYGTIQNFIFNAMSQTLFALIPGFDEDDEDEDDAKKAAKVEKKTAGILNGMVDSLIRGAGIYGAIFSTIKNTYRTFLAEEEKGFTGDQTKTIIEAANLSPAIGSKLRKVYSAIQTNQFDKDVIEKHPWSVTIDGKFNPSPSYNILGDLTSALINIPLDRALVEARGVAEALDNRNSNLQRIALGLGWRTWNVGAKNEEFDLIKADAKVVRKKEGREKAKVTRAETKGTLQELENKMDIDLLIKYYNWKKGKSQKEKIIYLKNNKK
jgi:hypothetical protein